MSRAVSIKQILPGFSLDMEDSKYMEKEKVFAMSVAKVYPLLIAKATRKGRTKEEVDQIICWLTGYTKEQLDSQIEIGVSYETFFNEAPQMHPNILQLRELYQSQQDAQQNKIMCILTVVTTLFLSLTLLTGWYGMNFAYMPELHWKYGYPAVIIVAIVIVAIEIMYFKKKKLF